MSQCYIILSKIYLYSVLKALLWFPNAGAHRKPNHLNLSILSQKPYNEMIYPNVGAHRNPDHLLPCNWQQFFFLLSFQFIFFVPEFFLFPNCFWHPFPATTEIPPIYSIMTHELEFTHMNTSLIGLYCGNMKSLTPSLGC